VGPIPVRVEFPFFLVIVLIGYNSHQSVTLLLTWVGVAFGSVLLHELGHAIVGREFGSPTSIVLYAFGGLTFHNGGKWLTARQDVLISLAGSLSQIVLLGIPAYMVTRDWTLIYTSYGWYIFFWDLMWVSLVWGIVNLLPIPWTAGTSRSRSYGALEWMIPFALLGRCPWVQRLVSPSGPITRPAGSVPYGRWASPYGTWPP
jgi:Zn-dependent protease